MRLSSTMRRKKACVAELASSRNPGIRPKHQGGKASEEGFDNDMEECSLMPPSYPWQIVVLDCFTEM